MRISPEHMEIKFLFLVIAFFPGAKFRRKERNLFVGGKRTDFLTVPGIIIGPPAYCKSAHDHYKHDCRNVSSGFHYLHSFLICPYTY